MGWWINQYLWSCSLTCLERGIHATVQNHSKPFWIVVEIFFFQRPIHLCCVTHTQNFPCKAHSSHTTQHHQKPLTMNTIGEDNTSRCSRTKRKTLPQQKIINKVMQGKLRFWDVFQIRCLTVFYQVKLCRNKVGLGGCIPMDV